jgi:two-component system chemotaxis response regulator CheY
MKTCLVVDDSPTVRRVLHRMLEPLPFAVAEAGDGRAALDLCRERLPDAILLDWNMPVMDGLAFLTALRRYPTAPARSSSSAPPSTNSRTSRRRSTRAPTSTS